ncbi:MAG TPA: hypothetical protein DCR87_06705, partial [Acidobacteria bacterium]|nr:hypothetical protein [Acidobacteriota bacterium]
LQVPVGSRDRLTLPTLWPDYRILESGRLIWENEEFVCEDPDLGVFLAEPDRRPVFWIESGKYDFLLQKT